jgi:hypothetical protein
LVNKELWDRAMTEIKAHDPNDYITFDKCCADMIEALGEDEDEAIEFMNGLDGEDKDWVDSIYEEMVDKFPTDKMEDFFDKEICTPAKLHQRGL